MKADIRAVLREFRDVLTRVGYVSGELASDVLDFAAQHAEPAPAEPSHLGPTCDQRGRKHMWQDCPGGRICVECKLVQSTWKEPIPGLAAEPAPPDTPEQLVEVVARAICIGCGGNNTDGWLVHADAAKRILSALHAAGAIAGPGQVVVDKLDLHTAISLAEDSMPSIDAERALRRLKAAARGEEQP